MEALLAIITGIALLWHLAINIKQREADSVGAAVWKFFSYYTILTNILVCVWAMILVFKPSHTVYQLATNANVATAITFYIVTVGLGNYLIFGFPKLAPINLLIDTLVHAIVPLLTLMFWVFAQLKTDLSYLWVPYWLIYPLSYALYTSIHAHWTRFYPYPFCDVQTLGAKVVARNTSMLTISVLLAGYLFVGLGKAIAA